VSEFFRRLLYYVRRRQFEAELDEELQFHLERSGKRQFGNITLLKEEARQVWRWGWLDETARDIRYSWRQFGRSPGLTLVVILTLALGVGANTTVFSILRQVLLRSLPYAYPDRLVTIWERDTERETQDKVTGGAYSDWKSRNHVFADLAYSWDASYTLTGSGEPKTLYGYQFSPNLFTLLGTPPQIGRTFGSEDGQPGRSHVTVLSDHLWRSVFRADAGILGRSIRLEGDDYVVVGVMPPEFAHPNSKIDLWTPFVLPSNLAQNWDLRVVQVIGRLRPQSSLEQARKEMSVLARQTALEHPRAYAHRTAEVQPIRESYVGRLSPALWVLQVAVFVMFLIACVNVANMFLARASTAEREVALRLALGAGRVSLMRQYAVHGWMLSFIGAALGVLLAIGGVTAIPRLFRQELSGLVLPSSAAGWIDWTMLGVTFAAASVGLLFGVVPALRRAPASQEVLKAGNRGALENRGAIRFRSILMDAQVALSLVLLVAAGLLIRSFMRLQDRPLGLETGRVLSLVLNFPANRYPGLVNTSGFLEQTLDRIRALPGVASAAAISTLPLSGADARRPFIRPDQTNAEGPQTVQFRTITPDYFKVMRIPLKAGRYFDDQDRQGRRDVVIINEQLARQIWPDGDAVGKTLQVADWATPEPREVVGIVGGVRHSGLASDPPIEVYRPAYQVNWPFTSIVVRTATEAAAAEDAVRQAVWSGDKDLPINAVQTMDELAAGGIALRRSVMLLLTVLAGIGVFLACLGIYSVISYSVALRTHEIGLRMALGATGADVLAMTVRRSVGVAFLGIAAGFAAALGLTRFLSALLFGVTATDATTLATAVFIMTALSAGAAYFPARRASSLDPMVALRDE